MNRKQFKQLLSELSLPEDTVVFPSIWATEWPVDTYIIARYWLFWWIVVVLDQGRWCPMGVYRTQSEAIDLIVQYLTFDAKMEKPQEPYYVEAMSRGEVVALRPATEDNCKSSPKDFGRFEHFYPFLSWLHKHSYKLPYGSFKRAGGCWNLWVVGDDSAFTRLLSAFVFPDSITVNRDEKTITCLLTDTKVQFFDRESEVPYVRVRHSYEEEYVLRTEHLVKDLVYEKSLTCGADGKIALLGSTIDVSTGPSKDPQRVKALLPIIMWLDRQKVQITPENWGWWWSGEFLYCCVVGDDADFKRLMDAFHFPDTVLADRDSHTITCQVTGSRIYFVYNRGESYAILESFEE